MWIKFIQDHNTPLTESKAGTVTERKAEVAKELIKLGVAEKTAKPKETKKG